MGETILTLQGTDLLDIYTQNVNNVPDKLSTKSQFVLLRGKVDNYCYIFPLSFHLPCFCLFLSVFIPEFNIPI